MKVVILDDESFMLRVAVRYLGMKHIDVVAIHVTNQSLEEVTEQIVSTNADVIVSDTMMGPFDGTMLVEALRQTGLDTPFILCSGGIPIRSIEERKDEMIASGVISFFLDKPYEPEALVSALHRVVDKSSPEASED